MSLSKALCVIQELQKRGILPRYAITGAIAALAYIEPTLTNDIDVLVEVSAFDSMASGLLLSTRLDAALADLGYCERVDVGILVEGWPIQFIPVSNELDEASLDSAVLKKIDPNMDVGVFVMRAEDIIAKALSIGREKDYARIEAFLTQNAFDISLLRDRLVEQNLIGAWSVFCAKTGMKDFLGLD
jgi:hypothetical protein